MESSRPISKQITVARVAGLLTTLTGLFVLVGWALGIPWIKSVLPGAVEMKVNTAVGLLVAGFALCLLDAPSSRRSKQFGQWLALFVAAIGFATLTEYVFGWNLGIDEWLFKDTTAAHNPFRGRMSPFSAVVFATLGLGLAALPVLWLRWLVWMTATLTLLIGGVSFIGYLWSAHELVTDRYIPPVAVHTAAAFILLGLGTFMASRTSSNRITNKLTELSRAEVKTLTGFLLTFLLLLLGGGLTYNATVNAEKAARGLTHSQEVRSHLGKLYASLSDAESQHRNYLLIGSPDYLAEYKRFDGEVDQQEKLLVGLVADNPAQTERLKQLRTVVDARQDRLLRTIGVFEKSGLGAAQDIIRLGLAREQMKAIRSTIKQMDSAEAKLLKVREADTSQNRVKTLIFLLITLAIAAAGCIVLFSGIRREMATRAEAEEERDRFFTLSLDMLCIANTDGYFKRVNPAFTQTLGWSTEEFLTRPFIDFIHPDDHAATLREVEKLAAGQPTLYFECRYQHKNGAWKNIAWRCTPQADGMLYATGRDVTDLKHAEETLRHSEESLAVTLQSIGDAVLATDTEGCVTLMNPIAEKLTGWTQTEAQGRPVAEVLNKSSVLPVEKVLGTGAVFGFENHTLIIARDGTECPIAESAAPIRSKDGRILGVVLVFRDVSKEQQAEEAIRKFNVELEKLVEERTSEMRQALSTLDASDDGAFIFDPDTLLHSYVNEGAIRQLGHTRQELLGTTPVDFNPEFTEGSYRKLLDPMLRGEVLTHRFITKHRHREGRIISVEINLQYITPVGERPRFIAIVRDITERLKMEKEHFRSQRLESIGTLAGGVAHDLNNSLAPIMMGVEMLKTQYPNESQILDIFQNSAKRGADMVRQLLGFAKGVEGKHVPLQISHSIKEMESMMKGSFPKNIELVVECEPDLPTVLGDSTQLHQVLLNLCVNARDAMPNGGKLTLEVQRQEVDANFTSLTLDGTPGKYVLLRVRDTGTGIPPEIIDRIFDPFFSTKGPEMGTGLGLSTVMGIVKGHGGFLQVYSPPGQGTMFSIYFPADRAETTDGQTKYLIEPVEEYRGQGETILFVDDEPNLRKITSLVLRRLNFNPLVAIDGRDGLVQMTENRNEVRAVITDLHMPGSDGLSFAGELRRMLPDIPIMVASGRMEEREKKALEALNVNDFLDKPFTELQLAAALKKLLAPK